MLRNVLQSTWKTEYAKSNNIWVTYTDDVNQDILAVIRTFSPNSFGSCLLDVFHKILFTEFLSKISNRKKISNEDFTLCEAETSLDEIIKSNFSNK